MGNTATDELISSRYAFAKPSYVTHASYSYSFPVYNGNLEEF